MLLFKVLVLSVKEISYMQAESTEGTRTRKLENTKVRRCDGAKVRMNEGCCSQYI